MTHLKRNLAATLAMALVLVFSGASPAASAPSEEEWYPPPFRCLDVTDGGGTLTVHEDTDPARNLLGTAAPTTTTIDFEVEVAAPSCSDGTYHIEVYDYVAGSEGAFLTRESLPGNETTTVGTSFTLDGADSDECVVVQVTTTDARGRVIDLAPDMGNGAPVGSGVDCPQPGSVWK